ncbi:Crp/Fnr family transcriptional regulator [Mesorhizobium sp. BR1-1-16]|uniref:Crp/Fnr family transcriptional regulator n=1 Tax=Mesorhizobium sp. BR1-1-16 TaxID=2876653 RepID=UPI001CCC687E|nr:Crp/Fnr family transcriptional regulator [Mesorhizobium sp. BR1-1-16]MBZ9938404.1 Crp/Fnr family transcriptional regulator [Mesorhizobium sp. BR1-1-16]
MAEHGWLSRQGREFQASLFDVADFRSVPKGAAVYSLGDPPGGLYGIVDGFVDVFIAPGPLPTILVYVAGRGWWVGDAALLTRTPRRVGLAARTDVRVMYVSEASLSKLAESDPKIWRRISEITVAHVDNALALSATLAMADPRRRLLATLWRLGCGVGGAAETSELPLTQAELGDIAGLSRNVVGRLLAEAESAGIARSSYARIQIDLARLKAALAV